MTIGSGVPFFDHDHRVSTHGGRLAHVQIDSSGGVDFTGGAIAGFIIRQRGETC